MTSLLRRLFGRGRRRLTLRARLAVLLGGLLLVLSMALVVFVNVLATATVQSTTAMGVPLEKWPTAPPWRAGDPTPTPLRPVDTYGEPLVNVDSEPVRQYFLGQLQLISIGGLLLVAIVGAAAVYWVAGHALRPLTEMARSARRVSVSTLNTRLAAEGPEDEIKELVDAFNTMLGRLEQSFEQQSQFAANAAHELRTPLSILRTNLEVMFLDENATVEDYREMVPVVERTLARLESLVEDLLAMSTEEGPPQSEEVALRPLVENVLSDLQPVAERERVKLNLQAADLRVRGDGSLLARVFSNLVENGILYNRSGGEVLVTMERGDGAALVTVADTGIGIPVEEQHNVFNRFHRVEKSRSRHKGGAGLGLSIVAHILQHHGGQVRVESAPGTGSKFIVQLPL